MSISIDGMDPARYFYNFYPGSTIGMVYFTLFVYDDYYNN